MTNAFYVGYGNDGGNSDGPVNKATMYGHYVMTPEVESYACPILDKYHPHLQEAAIAYLLRRGTWKSRGEAVTGRAMVAPDHWRLLCGYDLVLIINETIWQNLGDKGRDVLLDHELAHFTPPAQDKNGRLKWATRDHDLREFSEVVKRHGVCISDHRRLVEAAGQLDIESLSALSVCGTEENMGGDFDEADDNCFSDEDVPFSGEVN